MGHIVADQAFSIQVIGNIQSCRTEAEIYFPGSADPWAIDWEDLSGWRTEELAAPPVSQSVANAAATGARHRLTAYINRRGEKPPIGLSAAGLSLWLMVKDDGTAMGSPYP